MDSTLTARPNHYELLGVASTASAEDVKAAFAREISRPRAFGGLAAISIAYETLRNEQKRQAYDKSIGLGEPEQAATPSVRPYAMHVLTARPHPRVDPVAEPRTAAFIAASLREKEPAEGPEHALEVEPQLRAEGIHAPRSQLEFIRRLEAVASPTFQPQADAASSQTTAAQSEMAGASEDDEQLAFAWKRPAMIGGGLVVAVAAIGAIAGLDAGSDAQTAQPEPQVALSVPQARSAVVTPSPKPGPTLSFDGLDARSQRQARPVVARRSATAAPGKSRPTGLADLQLDPAPVEPGPIASPPIEPAVASEAPTPAAIPASMPLSNATIARTIGRIGYACGKVASTTAIEGEGPGVFKVTCTSGHSYKAASVRGRYHFRRLSN